MKARVRLATLSLGLLLLAGAIATVSATANWTEQCNGPAPDWFREDIAEDGQGLHHQTTDVQALFFSVFTDNDDLHVRSWVWQHNCALGVTMLSPTPTPTVIPNPSPTESVTRTSSVKITRTSTVEHTSTPVVTASPTPTVMPTPITTPTAIAISTAIPTVTPTVTAIPTTATTPISIPTVLPTVIPTATPEASSTPTPSPTPTPATTPLATPTGQGEHITLRAMFKQNSQNKWCVTEMRTGQLTLLLQR